MFTKEQIKKLVIPLIIEQLLAMLVGMMDVMMVSQVGESATSGVSLVDSITNLLVQAFAALATGGSVVAANLIGKRRPKEACEAGNQLVVSNFLIGILIMLPCIIFRANILDLIYNGIASDVRENALIYFLITGFSYPFLALYNSEAALCRSQGDSKLTMKASMVVNLINVSGNAILILGFHMGTAGVAIPTLVSRVAGAAILYRVLRDRSKQLYLDLRGFRFNFPMIGRILRIGIPTGIDGSIFQIGKLLVSTLVASLGTASTTAYAVANTLAGVVVMPGAAVGLGMVTVVGQCIGAGEIDQAKMYTGKLMKVAYGSIAILATLVGVFSPLLLKLYNLSDITYSYTIVMVISHSVMAILIWPTSFAIQNSLRAGGDAAYIMAVSVGSMWICRIILAYLFVRVFNTGVVGVYAAMYIDWLARSILFVIRFRSGKWIKFIKKTA